MTGSRFSARWAREGHLFILGRPGHQHRRRCSSISGAQRRDLAPSSELTHTSCAGPSSLLGAPGSRFWPLSTPTMPKQLLPLTGPHSTAEQALLRLEGLVPKERVLVVTSAALAPRLEQALALPHANVLIEPRAGLHRPGAGLGHA